MKLRITAILDYDAEIMHGDDPEAIEWFNGLLLSESLILHSNEIFDEVGIVNILSFEEITEDRSTP